MGFSCCVVNCKHTSVNSNCKFYSFPIAKHKIRQRLVWISAIRRMKADGSEWRPAPHERICSSHFVGGKKSDVETSPSYAPTIFPFVYKAREINEESALKKHERFMRRRSSKSVTMRKRSVLLEPMNLEFQHENAVVEEILPSKMYSDQGCQVDECQFSVEPLQTKELGKLFICNRVVTVFSDGDTKNNKICNEAEIQTDIVLAKIVIVPSQKQHTTRGCNTTTKLCVDSAVNVKPQDLGIQNRSFSGYKSLRKEQHILDLAGINFDSFKFLLDRVPQAADNAKLSQEDRLLIFLMKLKTGLTFSGLSVLFGVHRTTVSKICLSTLQHLASSTANLVFWPSKAEVQGTMPNCFYPDYSNTRVIIDCTEFKCEAPPGVDNRIHSFSYYKKGYTAKILIGITPGGFICFKSKVAGGRKCDSQITIESGLLDLIEEGDVVLADKGFPEIRAVMNENGKSAFIVMPPFLEDKKELTKAETEETYKIASVRIHVEKAIQRLKIYNILNKVPASLFHYMDDLLHVICVLVNLQPPIHADKQYEESNK